MILRFKFRSSFISVYVCYVRFFDNVLLVKTNNFSIKLSLNFISDISIEPYIYNLLSLPGMFISEIQLTELDCCMYASSIL